MKILHYCWFGRNKKPKILKKCLASWKKFCPDYEIKEWNEDNFDVNCCAYVKEAYQAKKWAFVSDYCRFFVLYNYGGIYLDTDVEIIKSIDNLPATFVGFENPKSCNSGLIRGALKKDKICKLMLESYENDHFILDDGKLNTNTVCSRETALFQNFGLKLDNTLQQIEETTVFPTEYFCPQDMLTGKICITENTYSIHRYQGSWLSKKEKFKLFIRKILGNKLYTKIKKIAKR